MFLQSEDHDINDFLKAVNFKAPNGFTLKYFIVPYAANTTILANGAKNSGFEVYNPEPNEQNVKGVTDTITYLKKDMKDRQSFNDSGFNLNQIPNEFPITRQEQEPTLLSGEQVDVIIDGATIDSPIKGVKVLESNKNFIDIKLEETFGNFPKYTLFHFVKNTLNENDMKVDKFKEEIASKDSFYEKINELCDRAIKMMEHDWNMSDDDRFADYKNALFFCRTSEGCLLKGRIIELIKNRTYFNFDTDDYDWPPEIWRKLCRGLKMPELLYEARATSIIDGCELDIRFK